MDEQCSPHEQLTAARGMWVLAFKCKDSIIKQPGCIEGQYMYPDNVGCKLNHVLILRLRQGW